MSMTVASLSLNIEDEIKALYNTPDDAQRLEDFADALAKAIIDEIKANATITLQAGDISIPAAGLVSQGQGNAVTGTAVIAAVTLNAKID